MSKLFVFALVAVLASLSFVPATFAQEGNAQVRVIHASPDAPAVDVFVDGDRVLSNVPFFTASDYLSLPAGTYRIQVSPTGQPASAAVIDANATVSAGQAYTIAATGLVASIQPTIIVDNLAAPASGNAKVRVYHFSPDAPAVDIKLASGDTLVSGLAFPNATDYLEVPAGTYDLQVTPAGASAVVIDLPGTTLQAGQIYSVFATDVVASITPQLAVTQGLQVAVPLPAPAPEAPTTLPTTSGSSAPLALFAAVALAMVAGALMLRRRASL
ncbi:cell wall anchor [Candidatus Chloroploca asiatica]|uniref:Cell wall anchor n=1 Tax=Candidatus Chloroploca asiatica TaxID=1506545 RepID=A0A2H3KLF2_9CHLR|nr:cell wall anchor [Candidatus Chloroploca asiatica]